MNGISASGFSILAVGFLLGGSFAAQGSVLPLSAATGYNAFAFSNFTEYSTDSLGRIAVGGDFNPTSGGFTIASQHGGDGAGTYDLVVGGNFTNIYGSVGGGDVFVGGNLTWNDPTLPHNVYVNGNFSNPAYGGTVGGAVYYGGTYSSLASFNHVKEAPIPAPIDFLSAKTDLQSLSANLVSQTANGTVAYDGYGTYTLTGNSSAINVFNLTDSTYNSRTINITAPAGSTVIVNVAGGADSFNGGSINLNGVTANGVIFNFGSATSLALSSIAFNGTILAPYANFNGTWGQLNGQLIANNIAGTTELHDYLFTGAVPAGTQQGFTSQSATPEPSTWMMLGGGLLLVGLARLRKRS